ncbi:MAG TPA: LLM class flavin-dependent oxidoreductase, partial [Jatrophihabitans sp.]|nr:LLM class flavin-dependent oxidoreductase [Jatrophihabitans sp.]
MTQTHVPGIALQGGDMTLAIEAAAWAERAGSPSFWTSEYSNRSALTTLAAAACSTAGIRLGSSIAWAFARTPLALATELRSINELAPGRVRLGLGTGNPQILRDWLNVETASPIARLTELVGLLRELWQLDEREVDHAGEHFRCRIARDESLPPMPRIPILLAGGRAAMVRAAGRIADGLIGNPLSSRDYVTNVVRPLLAEGASRRSDSGGVPPITGLILTCVSDDAAAARRTVALQLAVYAMRESTRDVLVHSGFAAEADAIRRALAHRDHQAAQDAV